MNDTHRKRAAALTTIKALVWIGMAFAVSAYGAEPTQENAESSDDSQVRSPSPDGRYALLATRDPNDEVEKERIELIELPTKRVLLVLSKPEYMPEFATRDATLHWSKDSQRVAFSRGGRRGGTTAIFARDGQGFVEVKLPDLPDLSDQPGPAFAKKHKEGFSRGITIRDLSFVRWLKSGNPVLELSNCWGGSSGTWGWHITFTVAVDSHRKATLKDVVKKEVFDKS